MSGRRRPASVTASPPVVGLAYDLQVRFRFEDHAEPGTHQRLVVRDQDAEAHAFTGSRARSRNPPFGARARFELAAVDRYALAHADQAVTAAVRWRFAVRSLPVVRYLDLDVAVVVAHVHLGVRRGRVIDRVRQALLHEAVRRQVDAGWERYRLSLDLEVHREAGLASVGDERVDPAQARLWRQHRPTVRIPERADHPPHLRERLAPGPFDGEQRLALLLLLGTEQPTHAGRLDRHHADAVAHDVVELSGDPRAFLNDGTQRVGFTVALSDDRPRLRGLRLVGGPAEHEAGEPADREIDRDEEDLGRRVSGDHGNQDRSARHDDREADAGLASVAEAAEEERRHQTHGEEALGGREQQRIDERDAGREDPVGGGTREREPPMRDDHDRQDRHRRQREPERAGRVRVRCVPSEDGVEHPDED